MRPYLILQDDQYELKTITHTRKTVRAIVFNEQGQLALHNICGDDIFGHRDYYETPGGGVKKYETLRQALKRELDEELGVKVKNIKFVARIVDYYNLVQQENDIYYYVCYVKSYGQRHFDEQESHLIKNTVWVDIDKAITIYESMDKAPLERLVKQRELPIVLLVKKMHDSQKN